MIIHFIIIENNIMSCENSYADTIILWGSDQTSLNLYAWQLFIKNRADVFFDH